MVSPKPSSEATAVEAAYESQVQTLFKFLITNLGDQPVSHQTDEECLEEFIKGLNVAKRARQLVRNVVTPSPPARSRRKSIKRT